MHIGIDLGTTYSCVMHHDGHDTHLIRSSTGEDLTASVVHFHEDGTVAVGAAAVHNLKLDPDNAAVGIKRHMGTDHPLSFHGRKLTPEGISALILRRLATDAAAYFGTELSQLRAVITVPAYFGAAEREATHAAAQLAELECLSLLAEPVSAAYAYGAEPTDHECSLVFDLGGGTFDVAVVGHDNAQPRVWAVDGQSQLGGLDWDSRLADLLWESSQRQLIPADAAADEEFLASLLREAEVVKRQLSGKDVATSRLRYKGKTYTARITRSDFDQACTDLVAQCLDASRRVLRAAASLGASPVVRILLVGGSTRMPMIRDNLVEALGLPVLIHDPDRAVARGAAILAAKLDNPHVGIGKRPPATRQIQSVVPRAIGIKIHSSQTPLRSGPHVRNVIPANTPLPVRNQKVTVATIVPNQERVRLELYEQAGVVSSEEPSANRLLFDGEAQLPPALEAGHPIDVLISSSREGRLDVRVVDGRSLKELPLTAFLHGVIDDAEFTEQHAALRTITVL